RSRQALFSARVERRYTVAPNAADDVGLPLISLPPAIDALPTTSNIGFRAGCAATALGARLDRDQRASETFRPDGLDAAGPASFAFALSAYVRSCCISGLMRCSNSPSSIRLRW